MSDDQAGPATLDADSLYAFCLHEVGVQQRMRADLSSLQIEELLWFVTIWLAHALETAARGLGTLGPPDPQRLMQSVAHLLWTPTPASLYDLWRAWVAQHSGWPQADSLQVPLYFLLCRTNLFAGLRELAKRGRQRHLPVFKGLAGLEAGPLHPDAVRQQRFLDAMDTKLQTTVRRRLDRTKDSSHDPSAIADAENVALLGVVERENRGRAWIIELLRRAVSIPTDSGQSIECPTIPELPVLGMERAVGLDAVWRAAAKESAIKVLAAIAPGVLGMLETTLPDAAHGAQRAERDRAAAKKRGGSGGRKAKKAGTEERAVDHVPLGNSNKDLGCIDPATLADDRPNPQQEAEIREANETAGRALRIALDRWGPSGRRMLDALAAGQTDKAAAKAAGVSAPALTKRLKTLKKLLD